MGKPTGVENGRIWFEQSNLAELETKFIVNNVFVNLEKKEN